MCDPLESRELPEGKGSLGAGDRQRGTPPRLEHEPVGDSKSLGGCGAEACSTRLHRSTSSPFTELPSEPCTAGVRSPERNRRPCQVFVIVTTWGNNHCWLTGLIVTHLQRQNSYLCNNYSCLPAGGRGDPGGRSAWGQAAAASASLWLSSSCQMMELESGTVSASGIPAPVTATLAGPGSWTQTQWRLSSEIITEQHSKLKLDSV